MRLFSAGVVFFAASFWTVSPATASVVTYTGFDEGASALGTNSTTARNNFLAAVGASGVLIDFEGLALGSTLNLTIAPGVTTTAGASVVNSSSCDANYCGDNTTPGGSQFLEVPGNTKGILTFNFLTPINAFGANFGGIQLNTIALTFDDGTTQSIVLAPSTTIVGGGFAFVGFTDFGKSIASVSLNALNDLMSMDDVVFATNAIDAIPSAAVATPEPSSFAMLALGSAALIFLSRARQRA